MAENRRGRGRGRAQILVGRPGGRKRRAEHVNYAESEEESPERGDLSSDEEELINNNVDPFHIDR